MDCKYVWRDWINHTEDEMNYIEGGVGIKELGKYHIVASCEHINSIRYANVGESTEKAFFLRFEKTVNWENPVPRNSGGKQ